MKIPKKFADIKVLYKAYLDEKKTSREYSSKLKNTVDELLELKTKINIHKIMLGRMIGEFGWMDKVDECKVKKWFFDYLGDAFNNGQKDLYFYPIYLEFLDWRMEVVPLRNKITELKIRISELDSKYTKLKKNLCELPTP